MLVFNLVKLAWCKFCNEFENDYLLVVDKLKEMEIPVNSTKVDISKDQVLMQKYEIQGFPTLKIFSKNETYTYKGKLDFKNVFNWVKVNSGNPSDPINDMSDLDKAIGENKPIFVFFGRHNFSANFEEFFRASLIYSDFPFYHCFDILLQDELDIHVEQIRIYSDFDKVDKTLTDFTRKNVEKFIDEYIRPPIIDLDIEDSNKLLSNVDTSMIFFLNENEESKLIEERLPIISQKLPIAIVKTHLKRTVAKGLLEFIGVKPEELPKVAIIKISSDDFSKYVMDGEINEENVNTFFNDYELMRLSQHKKNEGDGGFDNTTNVYKVVQKTYDSLVMDSDINVLMMFFRPDCPHCINFKSSFAEIAGILSENQNIIFGTFDVSQNEVNIAIKKVPNFWLFKKGAKAHPIEFTGTRSISNIVDFVKANMSEDQKEKEAKNENDGKNKQEL